MENYFVKLNAINVSDKIEKKNGLSYLSWAFAWGEAKKIDAEANYIVYERPDGCNYWTDGKTAWVKTGVIINKIEHIEYLPIMDYRNASILLEKITSFDVNKAIQRSLTKAVARHGLGLYIYAGEDLPEDNGEQQKPNEIKKPKTEEADTKQKSDDEINDKIIALFAQMKQYDFDAEEYFKVPNGFWKSLAINRRLALYSSAKKKYDEIVIEKEGGEQ